MSDAPESEPARDRTMQYALLGALGVSGLLLGILIWVAAAGGDDGDQVVAASGVTNTHDSDRDNDDDNSHRASTPTGEAVDGGSQPVATDDGERSSGESPAQAASPSAPTTASRQSAPVPSATASGSHSNLSTATAESDDAQPSPIAAATNTPTGTGILAATATPTRTPTKPAATATPTRTPTKPAATATPTRTPTKVATATPTQTTTSTATAMATATATSTPPLPVAPPDAGFNDPLTIPLDSTASVTDFVSFPNGDTTDRTRYQVTGMNPNAVLPGGRARLVLSVTCFGVGNQNIEVFTGGQTFGCGQVIVDKEVTADSDTGTVTITAVGGGNTYVQWVVTGTATRID